MSNVIFSAIQIHLLLPVFALVILTFAVLLILGTKRFQAAKNESVDMSYYKLYVGDGEPAEIRQISRNFSNLFEIPILFYFAIVLTMLFKLESMLMVYLAWGYVLTRYAHSYVHCTTNRIKIRFRLYLLSCFILMIYWIVLIGKTLF